MSLPAVLPGTGSVKPPSSLPTQEKNLPSFCVWRSFPPFGSTSLPGAAEAAGLRCEEAPQTRRGGGTTVKLEPLLNTAAGSSRRKTEG